MEPNKDNFFDKLTNELKYHDIVPQKDGSISIIDIIGQTWIRFNSPKEAHIYLAALVDINLDICKRVWKQIENVIYDIMGNDIPCKSEYQRIIYPYLEFAKIKSQKDYPQITDSLSDLYDEIKNSFIMANQDDLQKLFRLLLRLKNIYKIISYSKYRVLLIIGYKEEINSTTNKQAGSMFGPRTNWSEGADNVDGPYSRVDLPEEERVYEFDGPYGVAEGLQNRSEEIKNQARYNPEYDKNGIFFTYEEPANMPVSWWKIEQEDYPYKVRKVLMER